jgi:hypothetical protein
MRVPSQLPGLISPVIEHLTKGQPMKTVTPLPEHLRSAKQRVMNRRLWDHWVKRPINAHLDPESSVIFYDQTGMFEHAWSVMPDSDTMRRLFEYTDICYWSRGL